MDKSEVSYTKLSNSPKTSKNSTAHTWIIAVLLAVTAFLFYGKFLQSDLKWAANFEKFAKEKQTQTATSAPVLTTTHTKPTPGPTTESPKLVLIREKLAEQGQLRAELEQKLGEKSKEVDELEKTLTDVKKQSELVKAEQLKQETTLKEVKNELKHGVKERVQDLMYHHPDDDNIRGRPFSGLENDDYLKIYNRYMASKEITLSKDELVMPQALTAISENHFLEHNLTISTYFEHWPNGSKIMLWDLGLDQDKIDYVKARPEKYIYRKFDFDAYPPVVRWFPAHAFKIFCIMECLIEFQACMWMDSSISWTGDPKKLIRHFTQDLSPPSPMFYYITGTWHSTAYATHPDMFAYLPSNFTRFIHPKNKGEQPNQLRSGGMMFFNTENMKHKIMKFAVGCSLTTECIYPNSAMRHDIKQKTISGVSKFLNWGCQTPAAKSRQDPFVCHRDDQSLFDILAKNYYDFDRSRMDAYRINELKVAGVDRTVVRRYTEELKAAGKELPQRMDRWKRGLKSGSRNFSILI